MPKIMGFGFRASGLGLRVSVVFIIEPETGCPKPDKH